MATNRTWRLALMALAFVGAGIAQVDAERFLFKYQTGDDYRLLTEVNQDIYKNGELRQRVFQLYRIGVHIGQVEGTKAQHDITYAISYESPNAQEVYHLSDSYQASFWRDQFGVYTIDPKYFVPPVRNVPTFPDRELKPGDTWEAKGSEVQDFRPLGIPDPFEYLMDVKYRYDGPKTINGKNLLQISVSYRIAYRPAKPRSATRYPVRVTGTSDQTIYWDPVLGRPDSADDNYLIAFSYNDGNTLQYEGTAHSRTVESKALPDKTTQDIQKSIDQLKLPDVTVRQDPKGVTISLEDIQFEADSAVLQPSEQEKLRKIAEILKRYPDNDILVGGHTALAGTPQGRKELSEQRAQAVGQFLLGLGVRKKDQLTTQGFGAEKPVGDNTSAEGMKKNRRVEITILHN